MKCVDCAEEMTESELRAKVFCAFCNGVMHAECSMADSHERDCCEECFVERSAVYRLWAKSKGVEA